MKQSAPKKLYVILPLLLYPGVVCVLYTTQARRPRHLPPPVMLSPRQRMTLLFRRRGQRKMFRFPFPCCRAPGQVSLTHTVPAQRPETARCAYFFYTAPLQFFQRGGTYKHGTAAALDGYQSVGSALPYHRVAGRRGRAPHHRLSCGQYTWGAILSEAPSCRRRFPVSSFAWSYFYHCRCVHPVRSFVYTLISGGSRWLWEKRR